MKKCLNDAFEELHREVCQNNEFDSHNSGSTLTVVLVEQDQLYCANVGDSKAILIWDVKKVQNNNGKPGTTPDKPVRAGDSQSGANITILTTSHQPDAPKEKARITKHKGEIRAQKTGGTGMPGDSNIMRVYARGKDGPGLAVSRSIGDMAAHDIGVSEKPDIQVVKLDHKRMSYTLVVASDGLWNIFGPNLVLKHLNTLMNGAFQTE